VTSAESRARWPRLAVLGVAVAVVLLDRLVQAWLVGHIPVGTTVVIWAPVVNLTLLENSGAAFGILRHADWLFDGVAFLVLAAGLAWLAVRPAVRPLMGLGGGLVMGGAAGNLWDRLISGRVVDYIHVRGFAVFNLADSAIVVGMAFLLWEAWRRETQAR
jgi:signal peptidase II